ncbi:hypothetical protein RUM43_005497 [Polyplax serrata]|uniref:Uncharacterized protein n=1 Tax=Polyplax serrata TaxID=468196 RepID=A0AAN8PWX2_POLSC
MTDSCLKLLLTVTEEDIKIKEDLLKNNIFSRLAGSLRRQKNLLGENLILYGALVVTLVHENENAQCQAKSSGCLACLLYILKRLLDEVECRGLPCKKTEILICAVISSYKNPWNLGNQTESGCIIPKVLVLDCLDLKPKVPEQTAEWLWTFLKSTLEKNIENQEIFMNRAGLSILFSTLILQCNQTPRFRLTGEDYLFYYKSLIYLPDNQILENYLPGSVVYFFKDKFLIQTIYLNLQRVTEDKNPEEISLLLPKITALLVMFKSHRDFLQLASSYCCIVILFNVVNTCNASAMRNVALFLETLTKEVPLSLQLTQSFGRIEKTKIVKRLRKSMKVAFQDGVKDLRYKKILTRIITLITDKVRMSYSDEADPNSLITETDFCILHGPIQDSLDSVDIKGTSFIPLNLKRSQMMRPKRIVKRGGFTAKFIFRSCLGLFINLAVLLLPKIVKNFQD